eukprot:jgi/Tetstr1/434478/TSEL_023570.t1
MSSMTEHAANTEMPGLIAPAATHWTRINPTSEFQLLGGMVMDIQKMMTAQAVVVALLRDEMAERRRKISHLNNVVTTLKAGAPLVSHAPLVLAAPGASELPGADMAAAGPQVVAPCPPPHPSPHGAHEGSAPP